MRDLAVVSNLLAVACEDGHVRLWDVDGGLLVDTVPTADVTALAAGDTVLAALDTTGAVTLWRNARSDSAAAELPEVDLDTTVPASLVAVPRGEDKPRLRADLALRFDRDLEIRRVQPVPGPTASGARGWHVAIDRAEGWWEPVSEAGDLAEPRVVGAGEPVRLAVEADDLPELGDAGEPRGSVRLLLSSPLLHDDAVVTVSLDGHPDGTRATLSVQAASAPPGLG